MPAGFQKYGPSQFQKQGPVPQPVYTNTAPQDRQIGIRPTVFSAPDVYDNPYEWDKGVAPSTGNPPYVINGDATGGNSRNPRNPYDMAQMLFPDLDQPDG